MAYMICVFVHVDLKLFKSNIFVFINSSVTGSSGGSGSTCKAKNASSNPWNS